MIITVLGRNLWLGCALLIFVFASALMSPQGADYQLGALGAYSLAAVVVFVGAVAICKIMRERRGESVGFGDTPIERCVALALFAGAGAMSSAIWMPDVLGVYGGPVVMVSAVVLASLIWLACAQKGDIPAWARLSGSFAALENMAASAPAWVKIIAIGAPFAGVAAGTLIPMMISQG